MTGKIVMVQVDPATLTVLHKSLSLLPEELLEFELDPEPLLQSLEAGEIKLDVVVLGSLVSEPVQIAQRVQSVDKELAVLILSDPAFHQQMQQALQFSPFLGNQVSCRSTAEGEALVIALQEAITRTKQRRSYRSMLMAAQASLSNASAPPPQPAQYMERLLDRAPIGVVAVDEGATILTWNRYAEELLGISEREAIGTFFGQFFPESERQSLIDFINRCSTSETRFSPEIFQIDAGDSSFRFLEVTVAPITGRSGEGGSLLIFQDITDRKRSEDAVRESEAQLREKATELQQALHELQKTQAQLIQTEKMSSLGQMVAGIAHEINNPAAFIYGNITYAQEYLQDLLNLVELYQQEYPNPTPEIQTKVSEIELEYLVEDLPKLLNSLKMGAERIRDLILSLRNFSRLDEAEVKKVNLHQGIDSTLLILSNRITPEGITVIKNYGNLPLVECSPAQINQVFMNIIGNAIDSLHEQKQQPYKEIAILTETVSSSQIQVRIRDNGSGIPPEIIDKIFDPFFTTKQVGQGTGLGLAICFKIIEKHEGKINVNSQEGQKTEVTISLPVKQSVPWEI